MRKLLLAVACLALGTFAWAQANSGAGQQMNNQPGYSSEQGVSSQQQLNSQQEQFNNQQAGNFGAQNQAGADWYNQKLSAQVDQSSRVNATVAPSQTAALNETISAEQPSAMATNVAPGADWYNQKIAAQTDLSQREESVIKNSSGFAAANGGGAMPE
jgi:hypothetical protein